MLFDNFLNRFFNYFLISHITRTPINFIALCLLFQPLNCTVNVVYFSTDNVNGGSMLKKSTRNTIANSSGSSTDQGYFPLQNFLLKIHINLLITIHQFYLFSLHNCCGWKLKESSSSSKSYS